MPAKKGSMARETVRINKQAWLDEVERIAEQEGLTKVQLNKKIAPNKGLKYIVTLKSNDNRLDFKVVRALANMGADLNKIIDYDDETSEPETQTNSELPKTDYTVISTQIETIISLLQKMIEIWGGNHEQSV